MRQETILDLLQYAGFVPGRDVFVSSDELIQRVSRVRVILYLVALNYAKMAGKKVSSYLEASALLVDQLLSDSESDEARPHIPYMFPVFAKICGDRDLGADYAEVNWDLMSFRRSISPGSFGRHLDYPSLIKDVERVQFVDADNALRMMEVVWELWDGQYCRELYGATLTVNLGSGKEKKIHVKTLKEATRGKAAFPEIVKGDSNCRVQIHLVPAIGYPLRNATRMKCVSTDLFHPGTGQPNGTARDLTVGKIYEIEGGWDPYQRTHVSVFNDRGLWIHYPIYLFSDITEWTFPTLVECVSNTHTAVDTKNWPAEGAVVESRYALTPGKKYEVVDVLGWEVWDSSGGCVKEWFDAPSLRFVVVDDTGARAVVHFSCFKAVEWGLKKTRTQ